MCGKKLSEDISGSFFIVLMHNLQNSILYGNCAFTVRFFVHPFWYYEDTENECIEKRRQKMLYYSQNSKQKTVHFMTCRHGKSMLLQNLAGFETLDEAQKAGYRLCKHCNPLVGFYRRELSKVSEYCKSKRIRHHFKDNVIHLNTPYSCWQLVTNESGGIILYHKNRWELKRDVKSPVKGFHFQGKQCAGLLEYCEYIVGHDAYRLNNPEKKPPRWERKPPKKGTHAWRAEQKREEKRDRRKAIANVYHLFALLDAAKA